MTAEIEVGAAERTALRAATEVLSLPRHPYLDSATQGQIVEAVKDAVTTA